MTSPLTIRSLREADIPMVCDWARHEGFAPGVGDVAIYRQTDRQGLWLGCLGTEPVGCIAAVRYNPSYGFIGLFLVTPAQRGNGYGLQLWRHALAHLHDLDCVGLEAAPARIEDCAGWGFRPATPTTRWLRDGAACPQDPPPPAGFAPSRPWCLLEGASLPQDAVQRFDAQREPSPRPHFLRQWLRHPAGQVYALIDAQGACHGFGRIRPCLLQEGEGWRLGPVVAEDPPAARRPRPARCPAAAPSRRGADRCSGGQSAGRPPADGSRLPPRFRNPAHVQGRRAAAEPGGCVRPGLP